MVLQWICWHLDLLSIQFCLRCIPSSVYQLPACVARLTFDIFEPILLNICLSCTFVYVQSKIPEVYKSMKRTRKNVSISGKFKVREREGMTKNMMIKSTFCPWIRKVQVTRSNWTKQSIHLFIFLSHTCTVILVVEEVF